MKIKRNMTPPAEGAVFNRLVVIKTYVKQFKGYSKTVAECKCTCGSDKEVLASISCLRRGLTQSCGCLQKERVSETMRTHGLTTHPLYRIWSRIKTMCTNQKSPSYKNYGGRGISICTEWSSDFPVFKKWCEENGWGEGLEIDRIDNNGGYEPNNCQFVLHVDNQRNKRTNHILTVYGETKCVSAWAEDSRCLVPYHTLVMRLYRGWDEQEALETPLVERVKISRMTEVYETYQESKTLREWLKDYRCIVTYDILRSRLRNKWNFEEAISTPRLRRHT